MYSVLLRFLCFLSRKMEPDLKLTSFHLFADFTVNLEILLHGLHSQESFYFKCLMLVSNSVDFILHFRNFLMLSRWLFAHQPISVLERILIKLHFFFSLNTHCSFPSILLEIIKIGQHDTPLAGMIFQLTYSSMFKFVNLLIICTFSKSFPLTLIFNL